MTVISRAPHPASQAAVRSMDPMTSLLDTAFIAIPAIALASIGGIGIVGSGIAFGLGSLELGAIGGGLGLAARRATQKPRRTTQHNAVPAGERLRRKAERKAQDAARVRIRFTEAEVPTKPSTTTEIDDLRSGRF